MNLRNELKGLCQKYQIKGELEDEIKKIENDYEKTLLEYFKLLNFTINCAYGFVSILQSNDLKYIHDRILALSKDMPPEDDHE